MPVTAGAALRGDPRSPRDSAAPVCRAGAGAAAPPFPAREEVLMSEVFVRPEGHGMRVAPQEAKVRRRARGGRPQSEPVKAEPAAKPAEPKPAASKSPKSES